jgi:hypothetical protein
MDIVGVVYTSRSARPMHSDELDRLLLDARTNNAVAGVTGVLLYGDGQFFQYFEGLEGDVAGVYERIRRSTLHTHLVELERRKTPDRRFRKWFMGFREAPASVIQKLSQEHWQRELPWVEDHASDSSGMLQLMAFLGPAEA